MSEIETIFTYNSGRLGIDKNNRLYWNDEEIVTKTDFKLVWWVNVAIVIGAISTAVYALVAVLDYLRVYLVFNSILLNMNIWVKWFLGIGPGLSFLAVLFMIGSQIEWGEVGRGGWHTTPIRPKLYKAGLILLLVGFVLQLFGQVLTSFQ